MPIEIVIPRLGWSMEEATFIGWLKKHGEFIKAGEPLFTLESEKASQDVESTDDGFLDMTKAPAAGATVRAGQVIGLLFSESEKSGNAIAVQKQPAAAERNPGGSSSIDSATFESGRP